MEGGAAVERDGQVGGAGLRIHARFAIHQPCGGIRIGGECGDRGVLGGIPGALVEHIASRQQPSLVQPFDHGLARGSVHGCAGDVDANVADLRGQSRGDRKCDQDGFDLAVDRHVDDRGKIALRGGSFGSLRHCLRGKSVEEFFRHLRKVLPADQVHRTRDGRSYVGRGNDGDLIVDCGIGAQAC